MDKRTRYTLIGFCLLLSSIVSAEEPIRIGVLANRGTVACLEKWSSTADYLTDKIPGRTFQVIPLAFESVLEVAQKDEVDFFLVNSAMYVELEVNFKASCIATLNSWGSGGSPKSQFGGVIVFNRKRNPHPEWDDLENSRIAAVNPSSLGGWIAPLREMKVLRLDTDKIFENTKFLNNQDAVVQAVRDERADAGIVRTGQLESMEQKGLIRIDDFITLRWPKEEVESHAENGFFHSTRLYPEWAFSRAPHVSDELAKQVAVALFQMTPDSPAARMANSAGWILPMDYHSVKECLQILRVRPFEHYGSLTFSDKIRKNALLILVILAVMVATVWVLFLNRLVTWRLNGRQENIPDLPTKHISSRQWLSRSGPWIIAGLVVICLLGNYILRNQVVLPRFLALELRDSKMLVADCVDTVRREIHHLKAICRDWAFWDDSYEFINDHNPEYIQSNITWPVLHDSGIDMVIFCDLEGSITYQEIHHPSHQDPIELKYFNVERFNPENPLLQSSWAEEQDSIDGFLWTEFGPLMVTSSLISTSDGEASPRGTLIFGRFLTDEIVQSLSEQVKVDFKLEFPQNEHEKEIFSKLSPGNSIIEFPNKDRLLGYGVLTGFEGNPTVLLKMRQHREIMRRGRSIAGLISIIMVSAVIIISIGMLVWFSFLMVESVRRRAQIEAIVAERTADLKHREKELSESNEKLKKQTEYAYKMATSAEHANHMKTTVISNMGHEIRTPMQAVVGFSDLFLKTELSPQQREYLDKIRSATKSLSEIVKGILDFSRIEKGQIQIETMPFILGDVENELLKFFAPIAELNGLELEIDFSIGIQRMLEGDPLRLRQVLSNLISNALKFTKKGGVTVNASVVELTEEDVHLKFSVKDSGIGISKEQIREIFAAFKQADDSKSRRYGGIGIGLAVVERLSDLMGGEIEVESELGKGSTFSFTVCLGLSHIEVEDGSNEPEVQISVEADPEPSDSNITISDEVHEILIELSVLLVEGDARAIGALKELAEKDAFPGVKTIFQLVRRYDFEGALDKLQNTAERAGIDLSSDSRTGADD